MMAKTPVHGFTHKHTAVVNKHVASIPSAAKADAREDARDHGADEYREKS